MKTLDPVGWWQTGLEKKATNDPLSLTILGRGIQAGHEEVHATGEEERAGTKVAKLAVVIALDSLDGGAKLSRHVGKEISQCRISVRLKA